MNKIFNINLIIIIIFFVTVLVFKLSIINILRKLKGEHKSTYKKFGEPSLVFTDIGRDEVAWKNIMKEDFSKYPVLNRLKILLIISSAVLFLLLILGIYSYLRYFVFK